MGITTNKTKRDITFLEAFLTILVYIGIFFYAHGKFPTGMAILLCATFSAIHGMFVLKISWNTMFEEIMKMFNMGMLSILVLLMVGFISSSWIASGTIPTMIVFGLKVLNPSIFLVASFVITSIVSIATGSSWSTVATFGLALMGVARGLGIPVGIAGGAIVSGCWLGDKWSPLSDTTNLAAAVTGQDVFDVFKHNFPTSGIGAILAAIAFTILGFQYSSGTIDADKINGMVNGISALYDINIIMLLPVAVVIVMAAMNKPVMPVLALATAVAVFLAVVFQGQDLGATINCLYKGYVTNTGVKEIDRLLSGGGLLSVAPITMIIFCAFVLGGILNAVGVMNAFVGKLGALTRTRGSLVLTSMVTSIMASYMGGTVYTGVILGSSMYEEAYEKQGLSKLDLARSVLESSGHISAIIPWCGSHIMVVASLGITWVEFVPYYYSCWFAIILMIFYGFTGFFMTKPETVKTEDENAAASLAA